MNRHDGLRPWKCEKCDKDFVRQDDLKKHAEKHDRVYECPMCTKPFVHFNDLKEHAKAEHDYEVINL